MGYDVQSFFEVSKTESICRISHLVNQGVGEIYIFVVLELPLPIYGVEGAFITIWIVE